MGKLTYLFMSIAGLFGVVSAVPPTWEIARTMAQVGSAPVPATVAAAPVGRWVQLTDAKLRCESRAVYKDRMTFFLATDAGTANPFVAQFDGKVACEAAQASITGSFVKDPLTLADLAQFGLDAKGATGLRLFTQLATPKYLRLALVPFVAILLIGVAMAFYGLRGLLRAGGNARP
jgi:hypothetical protein